MGGWDELYPSFFLKDFWNFFNFAKPLTLGDTPSEPVLGDRISEPGKPRSSCITNYRNISPTCTPIVLRAERMRHPRPCSRYASNGATSSSSQHEHTRLTSTSSSPARMLLTLCMSLKTQTIHPCMIMNNIILSS